MDRLSTGYRTIRFRREGSIGYVQFHRPEANNTIDDELVGECRHVLRHQGDALAVVVLEGLPDVFLFGADFGDVHRRRDERPFGPGDPAGDLAGDPMAQGPEALYDLWLDLATGPWVSIAHVRGRANAGGVGFVAACDVVLAGDEATFSLSELLFGLYPACVLPFLIRRVGLQKAHYMTLMTQPVRAEEARAWGLVDACGADSADLLRKHLLRLRRLSKKAVGRYKEYLADLDGSLLAAKAAAVAGNRAVFRDPDNLAGISRFVETGKFPWEPQER